MGTYSRGTYVTLPTDDGDLTTVMSAGEVSDVATINNVFVAQNLSAQIAAEMFKNTCSASLANLLWVGQSDLAPSISPITLEAYNYSTAAWVGQATNAAAATNATCTLAVTLGITQYISPGGYTTGRVYQSAITESLMASFETFNDSTLNPGDASRYGQSFISNGKSITKIEIYLKASATLTGTAYLDIYNAAGSPKQIPTSLTPEDQTPTVNLATVPVGSWGFVTFTLTSPFATTNGNYYGFSFRTAGYSGGNLEWGQNSTGGYNDGNGYYLDSGVTWVGLDSDFDFKVWGQ